VDSSMFDTVVPLDQIEDTGFLVLINAEHPITLEPTLDALVPVASAVADNMSEQYLLPTTLEAIDHLFAAARAEQSNLLQMGAFFITSGHRNRAEQQEVYDNEPDKSRVMLPGTSEHHTGLAADVGAVNVSLEKMGSAREGKWLADNAARFGLVVRYPQGKQAITSISYEPWHLRYLGQPHAAYCATNDLTLEEYLARLKETGGYRMEFEGTTYHVLYQIPTDGIVKVPSKMQFNVSSDNTGGYLVTAWE